ncbi:hypothetical protein [Marinobacter sp. BGYM27]|uniref:hypothetical protein n=1 Tax=Marinobacter sp. BGYM27 TaxID=2975597 RepID=UPI0021A26374|nr:hypothetical protein [Marinobacter sp. BGYM27]MDG5499759.1 hypothetical protein [Marinobacter sp. BGYM27]
MKEILINIGSPSWWFTGLFFGVAVPLLLKKSPLTFRRIARNRLAHWKRRVKNASHSPGMLNYEIGRTNSLFVGFLIVCSFYAIWFTVGSLNEIRQSSLIAFILLILPIYIVEAIWLIQNRLTVTAIKRSDRMGAKMRSSVARKFDTF